MRIDRLMSLVVGLGCLTACGGFDASRADGGTLAADGGVDSLSLPELQVFVQSGRYLEWPSEAAAHPSAGPHGGLVRTFVNPTLRDSLKSGSTLHPPGSIVVKELSNSSGALTGYAVDAKRTDGTWVFFEGFLPQLNQYYFSGTDNLCGNCHQAGSDFVLTPASALP